MWKKIALTSIALWVLSVSFIAYKFVYGTVKHVDKRIEISLKADERELVLGEMRTLLKGLKGIIKGLAIEDFKVVEQSARSNGMAMAQDVNPALIAKLPLAFKTLGMGVHESFDELANNVHQLKSNEVLARVDTILNSCVACHSTYKINEKK